MAARLIKNKTGRSPHSGARYLILFVTSRCNSKCVMCFNKAGPHAPQGELTLSEYTTIAEKMRRKIRSLMISGGEPSLRDDLPEICGEFYRQCGVQKIHLPSNGQDPGRIAHMAERISDICGNASLIVGLSVDGIRSLHDEQRGVPGSFDRVMAAHEALSGLSKKCANLKTGIVTTVTKLNFNGLPKLLDYIYQLRAQPDFHDLMVFREQGHAGEKISLSINSEEYARVLKLGSERLRYYSRKRYGGCIRGFAGYVRNKMLDHIYLNAHSNKRVIMCKAPKLTRVIGARGDVSICEFKEPVANIRHYDYDLNILEENFSLSSMDIKCACTHPCFMAPSLMFVPNMLSCAASMLSDRICKMVGRQSDAG